MRFEMDKERDEMEAPILQQTGYDLIFPVKNDEGRMRKYGSYLKLSKELQDQFTHGRTRFQVQEENVYDMMLKALRRAPNKRTDSKLRASTVQKSFDLNHRSDKKSTKQNYQLVFNKKNESKMI